MEVERNIKVFNQADTCKTVKKTYNVEYKELPSQSKSLDITKNGNYQVTPDCGYTLNKADIKVNVEQTTPVVTKESTEQIADYAYQQKECGRAGAKIFLYTSGVVDKLSIINDYLFPLEIGKTLLVNGQTSVNERKFTFKILLKKGINHIHAIYNSAYKSQNGNCVIKSVEVPDCAVILDNSSPNHNMFGNYTENIEIEAKEDGIYDGTLIAYNYREGKYINRIRLCKPVCAVLCNVEFPTYGDISDLINGDYGTLELNYKNVILYTTNPQSFDWKFKKVDPMLGIKLKYHNTFIYKDNFNDFYRNRLKDRITPIIHCVKYKPHIIHLNSDNNISYEFNMWLNSIFLNQSNLCIEMLCTVKKSYPSYNESKRKYLKCKIGKKHEYIKNYDIVLDHLQVADDVIKYINRKINFNNYKHRNNSSKYSFFIKIRISADVNSFKKWYYYRIPCMYDEEKNAININKGIIFEKIEYSTEEHF